MRRASLATYMAWTRFARRPTRAVVVVGAVLALLLLARAVRGPLHAHASLQPSVASAEASVPTELAAVQRPIAHALEPGATDKPAARGHVQSANAAGTPRRPASPALAALDHEDARSALGRQIFFDEGLSEPRGTSCASCHDPQRAYAGNHGSKLGTALGSRLKHFARRNTPSLLYLKYVRPFHFKWEEDAQLPDAVGGFFWDGRSDSIAELVRQPLLNPDEMGNLDARHIADKLHRATYADQLGQTFGLTWTDPEAVLHALGVALEAFLTSAALSPFSSKYDAYLRGQAQLSALEKQGLELFRDANKGGCDFCHKMNTASPNPERSLFTDFGFEALAVPRNRKLPANRDPARFDLGLCEPDARRFPIDREQWCGSFRTPSLRNVAVRTNYMHNGAFDDLREVVKFYVTRGVTPRRWYKSGATYDDVPTKYRVLTGVERVPYDRHEGQVPRLDDHEIDAVVAFLRTLTDAAYE